MHRYICIYTEASLLLTGALANIGSPLPPPRRVTKYDVYFFSVVGGCMGCCMYCMA